MKRALSAATLTVGLLAGGGAATASASPVASSAYVASSVAGSASVGHADSRPAVLNAPVAKAQAAFPERRRTTTTKKKKSGIGRIFGALAFLFIGLPLLIIAALVIFFVMRSNRKKRERDMAQMNTQQYNNDFTQGPGRY